MKFRKLMALGLSVALTLSLAACGTKSAAPAAPAATEAPATEAPAATEATAEASAAGDSEATAFELVDDTTGLKIACDPITLTMGCSGNLTGSVRGESVDKYLAELKEWTDGNFVIDFYPDGKLGGDAELIEATQMGTADIFMGAPSTQSSYIPELAVLDIPALFEDVANCNDVLDGFLPVIQPYYEKQGLHIMTAYSTGFRLASANKPLKSMADLKGIDIRIQENKYHKEFWSKMGTNPTPLAAGEVYIALQQNMLNAQENVLASFFGAKLYEVQSYMMISNHIPFIETFVMNKDRYESLTDSQKQALSQFFYSVRKYAVERTADGDAKMLEECEANGMTIGELPEDVKAAYPAATQAVVDLLKKDIDPDFVDKYLETVKSATGK